MLREARAEAVIVLALNVALLVGLAVVDKAKDWHIISLQWWSWLLLAAPAPLLMIVMAAEPLTDLAPGACEI